MDKKIAFWKMLCGPMLLLSKNLLPQDPLDNVDIEREYQLIKQKKSKLPRRIRDLIVARVEEKNQK